MRSAALALVGASLFFVGNVSAEDVDPLAVLLPKLAVSSARFEQMMKKATYTITGRMETLSGNNEVSDPKEGSFKIVNDGSGIPKVEVIRYAEDGQDKTEEAKKKAAERAKERESKKKDPDEETHMPFLGTEQGKYDYRIGEHDAKDVNRVRVYFTPRSPAKNLIQGSAWVDSTNGNILSMGASPSKTPAFVDYLKVQVECNEMTSMGPAPSKIVFEGGGGILFIKKRFRGAATLTGWQVPP